MNQENNISAYILCGGKSSRMKTEKGLVNFLNKPFIQWVIEAIEPITQNIFLVTDNQDYIKFGYPLISDVYKSKGPVGGVFTALNHSTTDRNLVLSCDVPNITTFVIHNYLINNLSDCNNIIFLSDNENSYPLIAIYNKGVAPKLLEAIQSNKLKLADLLSEFECKNIKVGKEHFESLRNINSKEELQQLELIYKELNEK